MRDPFLAAILSFIIPGTGQFYNGRIFNGLVWFFVTVVLWIVSATTLGWVCHFICAYAAYRYAKEHPVRR